MEKNKDKAKLNDELLDQVSGGVTVPMLEGGGTEGGEIYDRLICINCAWNEDESVSVYRRGDECPSCHRGKLRHVLGNRT